MTGHFGERRNRQVALVTDDFRTYHTLVPFLESHQLRVLVLRPGDTVPGSVLVLLGGPASDPRSIPVRTDLEATLLAAYTHLDRRPGVTGYKRVVIGIDPGKVTGLAVVADGRWLHVGETQGIPEAVERVAAWVGGLAAESMAIHVGAQARDVGKGILVGLRARLPGMAVDYVPEHATTPWSHVTGSRHTDAAIHIAMRSPD